MSETGSWMRDMESFSISLEDIHPPAKQKSKFRLDSVNESMIGYAQD